MTAYIGEFNRRFVDAFGTTLNKIPVEKAERVLLWARDQARYLEPGEIYYATVVARHLEEAVYPTLLRICGDETFASIHKRIEDEEMICPSKRIDYINSLREKYNDILFPPLSLLPLSYVKTEENV